MPKLNKYLDWFNILSYDYHSAYEPSVNHHAPLYPIEEENEYSYDTDLNIVSLASSLINENESFSIKLEKKNFFRRIQPSIIISRLAPRETNWFWESQPTAVLTRYSIRSLMKSEHQLTDQVSDLLVF